MDTEKSSCQAECAYDTQSDITLSPLPTVNVRIRQLSNKDKDNNIWTPFYVLGVFGCVYLLFHLYISTAYHHAALDNGLHKLEEELHDMIEFHRVSGNVSAFNTVNPSVANPVRHGHHRHDQILPHERKRHWGGNKGKTVESQPVKRDGSVLTWFHPGLGACGSHSNPDDFICAISYEIWNGGAHCGDKISISYRGKIVTATVVDECMSCAPNHIDLSPGLLRAVAGAGTDMVTDAQWVFGDFDTPKPTPKPTLSATYHPTTKEKPTTTPRLSSTSTSRNSSSNSIPSSASPSSTASSSSASAYATSVAYDDDQVHNIENIEALLVSFGELTTLGGFGKE